MHKARDQFYMTIIILIFLTFIVPGIFTYINDNQNRNLANDYIQEEIFNEKTVDIKEVKANENNKEPYFYFRVKDENNQHYTVKIEKEKTIDTYAYSIYDLNNTKIENIK